MAKKVVVSMAVLERLIAAVEKAGQASAAMIADGQQTSWDDCPHCAARREAERARKERYRLGL